MQKTSIPWSTKQIYRMAGNGSLVFDNALQRSFCWEKYRSSLLIDSLLRGYPVPAYYVQRDGRMIETPKGQVAVHDALDGKQRNNAVILFKDNLLKLVGLEPITLDDGSEIELNGLTYDTLPDELREKFDSASFTVYIIMDATAEEVAEIMRRLNNGKSLSAIDITRIKAKDLYGIQAIGNHKLFQKYLSDKSIDSHQQEDIVIKSYALLYNITLSLDNKDVRPIYETQVFDMAIQDKMNSIYNRLLSVIDIVYDISKKTGRKLITKTHMLSVLPMVARSIEDNLDDDSVARWLLQFFDEGSPSSCAEYNGATKDGCNHADRVSVRLNALSNDYKWYFKL